MRFFSEKKRSAGYARDRMKLLLVSERIDCSPQMMKLLRNDLIHTVKKYVVKPQHILFNHKLCIPFLKYRYDSMQNRWFL